MNARGDLFFCRIVGSQETVDSMFLLSHCCNNCSGVTRKVGQGGPYHVRDDPTEESAVETRRRRVYPIVVDPGVFCCFFHIII